MTRLPAFETSGATALVTGAAGGMGAQLALRLARGGARLVLIDRRAAELSAVADLVRRLGPEPTVLEADLADRQAVLALTDGLRHDLDGLDLLINNAGVAMAGNFDEIGADEFDWLLQIDLLSPIMIIRELLPLLKARPGSHIVNVSSVFGLHGPYGQSPYATAKFGLRGFSQSLAAELVDDRIGVTWVMPGGIDTGIAVHARVPRALDAPAVEQQKRDFDRYLRYPADRAAERILNAVITRRHSLLIGADARAYDLASRLAPGLLAAVMRRGARQATER